jgi:methionyl-tRNA formyltransferase
MKIHIIGDESLEAVKIAREVCEMLSVRIVDLHRCDVAIAPSLNYALTTELSLPVEGTLVFHPSLLPTRRGGDAIKWAYKHGDNIGGVSWFWAAAKMDDGDICSQEAFPIDKSITPREHYNTKVLPALRRTLITAILEFKTGYFRRVKQVAGNSTFDFKIKKHEANI